MESEKNCTGGGGGGDVLVSQFIIQEKRSKEHLTPPARHRGPINDKDDDSHLLILHDHFISIINACVIFVNFPNFSVGYYIQIDLLKISCLKNGLYSQKTCHNSIEEGNSYLP